MFQSGLFQPVLEASLIFFRWDRFKDRPNVPGRTSIEPRASSPITLNTASASIELVAFDGGRAALSIASRRQAAEKRFRLQSAGLDRQEVETSFELLKNNREHCHHIPEVISSQRVRGLAAGVSGGVTTGEVKVDSSAIHQRTEVQFTPRPVTDVPQAAG